jgi:hypothetical protein
MYSAAENESVDDASDSSCTSEDSEATTRSVSPVSEPVDSALHLPR